MLAQGHRVFFSQIDSTSTKFARAVGNSFSFHIDAHFLKLPVLKKDPDTQEAPANRSDLRKKIDTFLKFKKDFE
jgi:hypothetical protein